MSEEIGSIVGEIQALQKEAKEPPKQEFDENGKHRLVFSDGKASDWVHYTDVAYCRGWVSCTAYYGDRERVMTPEEFCTAISMSRPEAH